MKLIREYLFEPARKTVIAMHKPATCFSVEAVPGTDMADPDRIRISVAQETDNELYEVTLVCFEPDEEIEVEPGMKWLGRVVCNFRTLHVFQSEAPDVRGAHKIPIPRAELERMHAEMQRQQAEQQEQPADAQPPEGNEDEPN